MIAKVLSGGLLGIDAYVIEVEVDISLGLPIFATVGLPDGAVSRQLCSVVFSKGDLFTVCSMGLS